MDAKYSVLLIIVGFVALIAGMISNDDTYLIQGTILICTGIICNEIKLGRLE